MFLFQRKSFTVSQYELCPISYTTIIKIKITRHQLDEKKRQYMHAHTYKMRTFLFREIPSMHIYSLIIIFIVNLPATTNYCAKGKLLLQNMRHFFLFYVNNYNFQRRQPYNIYKMEMPDKNTILLNAKRSDVKISRSNNQSTMH